MFKYIALAPILAIVISGCMSPAVHVYNGTAKEFRNGSPDYQVGATGEITYCNAGITTLVESRRQEALQKISDTCKGDSYAIAGETPSYSPSCTRTQTIVFKCNGGKKKSK
jgi:hypothetical protein